MFLSCLCFVFLSTQPGHFITFLSLFCLVISSTPCTCTHLSSEVLSHQSPSTVYSLPVCLQQLSDPHRHICLHVYSSYCSSSPVRSVCSSVWISLISFVVWISGFDFAAPFVTVFLINQVFICNLGLHSGSLSSPHWYTDNLWQQSERSLFVEAATSQHLCSTHCVNYSCWTVLPLISCDSSTCSTSGAVCFALPWVLLIASPESALTTPFSTQREVSMQYIGLLS